MSRREARKFQQARTAHNSEVIKTDLEMAEWFLSHAIAEREASGQDPRIATRSRLKTLVSTFALALALAFTGPAFAGDVTKATDKASCDKAGGMWDETAKKCSEKM